MSNFKNKIIAFLVTAIIAFFVIGVDIAPAPSKEEYSLDLTQESVVKGRPFDAQLVKFYKNSEKAFILPGLQQGFVPQGVFYSEENEIFLVSGYYKNGKDIDKSLTSRICLIGKKEAGGGHCLNLSA